MPFTASSAASLHSSLRLLVKCFLKWLTRQKKPTADPLTERELCVLRLASRTQAALYALKTRLASLEDGISGDG